MCLQGRGAWSLGHACALRPQLQSSCSESCFCAVSSAGQDHWFCWFTNILKHPKQCQVHNGFPVNICGMSRIIFCIMPSSANIPFTEYLTVIFAVLPPETLQASQVSRCPRVSSDPAWVHVPGQPASGSRGCSGYLWFWGCILQSRAASARR